MGTPEGFPCQDEAEPDPNVGPRLCRGRSRQMEDPMGTSAKRLLVLCALGVAIAIILWLLGMSYVLTD